VTIFDVFRQKVISFNLRQGYDLQKNLNDSAAIAPLALMLLLFFREEKNAGKAKPRVIVGRKATGPDQDSRVAKAKIFLQGPVVHIDHGLFIAPKSKWKEVIRYDNRGRR
jgi:hypothetical protein